MQLLRQLAEGPPYVVLGGVTRHAEGCIRVVGHGQGILVCGSFNLAENVAAWGPTQVLPSRGLGLLGDADFRLALQKLRQGLESADLAKVISDVKAKLVQLDAAQSAFARINQKTLFDLIS